MTSPSRNCFVLNFLLQVFSLNRMKAKPDFSKIKLKKSISLANSPSQILPSCLLANNALYISYACLDEHKLLLLTTSWEIIYKTFHFY